MFIDDKYKSIIEGLLLRQMNDLQSVFKRTINYNEQYAYAVARRIGELDVLYSSLSGIPFIALDSQALDEYLNCYRHQNVQLEIPF